MFTLSHKRETNLIFMNFIVIWWHVYKSVLPKLNRFKYFSFSLCFWWVFYIWVRNTYNDIWNIISCLIMCFSYWINKWINELLYSWMNGWNQIFHLVEFLERKQLCGAFHSSYWAFRMPLLPWHKWGSTYCFYLFKYQTVL